MLLHYASSYMCVSRFFLGALSTKNVPLMHRINHLMIKVLGQSDQQKAWDYSSNIWGPW